MAQLGIVKANLEVTPTEAKIDNVLTTKKHQDYVLNGKFSHKPVYNWRPIAGYIWIMSGTMTYLVTIYRLHLNSSD